MSEKTVSVRLKLIHDAYVKAAKEASTATNSIAKADNFKKLGQETAQLGDKLTRNVTLPIVGVGIAAVKMSGDFDKAFVAMQSLAGVAADEIDGMKKAVLDLAGETGKAPQELSEALYFLRSSGLDAAGAMDALEMSAKASAAGMGSTVQIADAVSSAMNAYAQSGLSAAEATDVLVATAREGKAEPAELAAQMGRLLPISSELGITFNDVGAGLAALSLKGGDAAQSATTLAGIMSKLLKPSQQGAEALADVGISLDDVRGMIADKGLLGTLETLRASLGDVGFAKMMEDTEAIRGALALTGGDVDKNREIFEALGDSVGSTDKAFQTWAKSMGAENAQAWAKFQVALIRLGDTLAPIASDVIGFASAMLEWFEKLPGPVKQAAGALVVLAAVAGPLLSVAGRLLQIWGTGMKLASAFLDWASGGREFAAAMNQGATATEGMNSKVSRLKGAAGLAGAAVAIGAVVFALKSWADAREAKEIEETAKAFSKLGESAEDAMKEAVQVAEAFGHTDEVFGKILETSTAAASRFIETAESLGMEKEALNELRGELQAKIEADRQAEKDQKANTAAVKEGTSAFDEEAAAITQAVEALKGYADALQAQFDPLFGLLDAHNGVRDARLAVDDATRALTEAEKEHGKGSAEAAEAQRDLSDAHDDAVRSALGVEQAQIALASAVEDGDVSLHDARNTMQDWVKSGYITQAEADVLIVKFSGMAGEIRDIPRTWNTHVSATGISSTRSELQRLKDELSYIAGKTYTARVVIAGTSVGVTIPGGVLRAAGGPVRKNKGYVVGEDGPEWFEPDENGMIVPNHMLGNMAPQSAFGGGGGTTVVVNAPMAGAIIASSAQARAWVTDAWNQAVRKGTGVNIKASARQY